MPRTLAVAALASCLALAALPVAAQQMYRWVDKNGKVHYTDTPPQTPAANVEQRRMAAGGNDGAPLDYGTQQAAKNFPVVIYTAPNCEQACKAGRELLAKRGVPFSEVQVMDDASRERLQAVSKDNQVPVLTVGRDVTKGFEPGMWTTALDAAGYPKNAARRPTAAAAAPAAGAPKAESKAEAPGAQPAAATDDAPSRPRGKYLP